mmetsp:Transcript_2426/g.3618  ORF Transcript_2426/g.3618 Transcript_2426/m.3618 type:complete len:90 (-) Transcript_2426:46-315(-)
MIWNGYTTSFEMPLTALLLTVAATTTNLPVIAFILNAYPLPLKNWWEQKLSINGNEIARKCECYITVSNSCITCKMMKHHTNATFIPIG